jgi:hypothetical protein
LSPRPVQAHRATGISQQRDGTFTDVSRASGIGLSPGKGLGVAINDFDLDGWPEILIANDSFPQQLFRNNRDGTFTEIGLKVGLAYDMTRTATRSPGWGTLMTTTTTGCLMFSSTRWEIRSTRCFARPRVVLNMSHQHWPESPCNIPAGHEMFRLRQ